MRAAPNVGTPGEVGTEGRALRDDENTNAAIVAPVAEDCKRLTNIKVDLAMAGHAVHDLADGGFIVVATKWLGMCRECRDVHALAAFAKLIGARA